MIVDPIDGTQEYLQGLPEYALSVGLAVGKAGARGGLQPGDRGNVRSASGRGDGANGALETAIRRAGRARGALYEDLPPLPSGARVHGVGSVAYRLALLSGGKRGDAVVTGIRRMEWDVAAWLCLQRGCG